jgi:hypothetical protein
MKNIIISIAISILITFVVTENYMISTMQISGAPGAYTITVFGAEFEYK